jgi:hypothetical protein
LNLPVGSSKAAIDDEAQFAVGELLDETLNNLDRRVVIRMSPEDDLVTRPILIAEGSQTLIEIGLTTADRL